MFDSKTTLTGRLTDAVDLLIDFATLGEYGLEPVGRTSRACEADRRPAGQDTLLRGPRRNEARFRGVRVASGKPPARGAAWQRHASRGLVA